MFENDVDDLEQNVEQELDQPGQEELETEHEENDNSLEDETPSWEPDYKFKVLDEEHDIPEYMRSVITQDNYDEIRELHEKAYGLDHVKKTNDRLKGDIDSYKEMEKTYHTQQSAMAQLGTMLEKKDYHNLFRELKIDDESVMQYALDRLNYQELPPEQQQAYDANIQNNHRVRELESEVANYRQQQSMERGQARLRELDDYLSKDDLALSVQEFDKRAGKEGAFRQEVINRGQTAARLENKDLSVEEIVNSMRGYLPQVQAQAPIVEENVPVLPPIRSAGAASPTGRIIKSIDDLKKRYDAL